MTAPIGPGDWVECISGCEDSEGNRVVLGAAYRVVATHRLPGGPSVSVAPGLADVFWFVSRFRPLPRSQHIEQLIEHLKQPAPERELEGA